MTQVDDLPAIDAHDEGQPIRRPRRWPRVVSIILLLTALALAAAWIGRKPIADNVISGQLRSLGLPATYDVVTVSPERQVIANLVIGDPKRPDLTVERVEVKTQVRFGVPGLGRVTLVRPRLYGSFRDGRLSFGSLDKVLFTDSKEPFRLPDLDLKVTDARARIDTDFGPVGIKLAGQGPLRGGFDGILAAAVPQFSAVGCTGRGASLFGSLNVDAEMPRFRGPLRFDGIECAELKLTLSDSAAQLDMTLDRPLDGGKGNVAFESKGLAYGKLRSLLVSGHADVTYRKGTLNARYGLEGSGLTAPQARLADLWLDGRLRADSRFRRVEIEGDVSGRGLSGVASLDAGLANVQAAAKGTLADPLLGRVRASLAREGRNGSFSGSFLARRSDRGTVVVVPNAALRGQSEAALVGISRLQVHIPRAGGRPLIAGSFSTGGPGLPKASGVVERGLDGGMVLRAKMADYVADDARIALPELTVTRTPGGALAMTGQLHASGALPGGRAENLVLPIEGGLTADGDLQLWRACMQVSFDRLVFANLAIHRRQLPVCPAKGHSIVSWRDGKLKVAGGVAALDLAGRLGETPIRIASGPVGFAWPGQIVARAVDVSLGPEDTASRFRIASLNAEVGKDIGGTFEDSDVSLYAVPLDLREASGTWRYSDGALTLDQGSFRLTDRQQVPRFQPLIARDATLTLEDNRITAEALLREPASDREVVATRIVHELESGSGHADLRVSDLAFDKKLQPDTLTTLALGVIANAKGSVRGTGRIDWDGETVRSHGRFTTDSLDFAAAFGPVEGLSGTVEFTDLLGLVTAPGQRVKIASVNPGIEVNEGTVGFALRPGHVLDVTGGEWPFMGGTLYLEPVTMTLGIAETRRYALKIDGLDAALFVERMDLGNLAATGVFDGRLPLVFDENGGRIEGGLLEARAPGGNVSYVGELTYEDLSPMANFAFDALRSLNYTNMAIAMDGALAGEVVTRVRFNGVTQGEGATSNFLTRRVASLPLQFNVNLRAPFMQLVTSLKSFYDPAFVRDPRSLGLIGAKGERLQPTLNDFVPPANRQNSTAGRAPASIQPPESEEQP